MGSALRDEYPVDPETVWSPLRLLLKPYERITLHPDDRRYDLTDADVTNEWHAADPRQRIFTGDNTVPYLGSRAKFIPTEQVICLTPSDFSFWEFGTVCSSKPDFTPPCQI